MIVMDIGTIRGIGTVLVMVAFVGVLLWAYGGKRKERFDEDALVAYLQALGTNRRNVRVDTAAAVAPAKE